jgi:hypothetical protein
MQLSNVIAQKNEVYELKWDLSHIVGDLEYDAWLEKDIEGIKKSRFWRTQLLTLPKEPVKFESFEDILENTDYPYSRERWPIMSMFMLDTLLAVQDFPNQVIPLTMIDVTGIWNESAKDFLRSGKEIYNFVAVHLIEHLDIFNWDESIYVPSTILENSVDSVEKMVLKQPLNGYPPLFRIKTCPTHLYVSAEARTALESANIKGVKFSELENS